MLVHETCSPDALPLPSTIHFFCCTKFGTNQFTGCSRLTQVIPHEFTSIERLRGPAHELFMNTYVISHRYCHIDNNNNNNNNPTMHALIYIRLPLGSSAVASSVDSASFSCCCLACFSKRVFREDKTFTDRRACGKLSLKFRNGRRIQIDITHMTNTHNTL